MSTENRFVNFGIEHLDSMLKNDQTKQGILKGTTFALIGEEGTHKSRLARAFLSSGLNDGDSGILFTFGHVHGIKGRFWQHVDGVWKNSKTFDEVFETSFRHRRLSAQGLSAERFVHIISKGLFSMCSDKLNSLNDEEIQESFDVLEKRKEIYVHQANKEADAKRADLKNWLTNTFPNKSVPWAEGIRVVIDDYSQFCSVYPDLADNRSVLGYLVDMFKIVGFTTLIVDTQSGSPFDIVRNDIDREMRGYIGNAIYTWTIRLGGESRVAITAIPPVSDNKRNYIRELVGGKKDKNQSDGLQVSRHLELYNLTDEGEPVLTEFRALLFEESPHSPEYLQDAEQVMRHATGHSFSESRSTITKVKDEWLRDMLHLRPDDFSSGETVVVQVDNWWVGSSKPAGNKGEGRVTKHLMSLPATFSRRVGDPNDTQQRSMDRELLKGPLFDSENGLERGSGNKLIPYYWNFSFLMLRQTHWSSVLASDLYNTKWEHAIRSERYQVVRGLCALRLIAQAVGKSAQDIKDDVQEIPRRYALEKRISWPDFLAAARSLAEIENARTKSANSFIPFAIACPSPETLNCVVLEIWASMIDDVLSASMSNRASREFIYHLKNSDSQNIIQEHYERLLPEEISSEPRGHRNPFKMKDEKSIGDMLTVKSAKHSPGLNCFSLFLSLLLLSETVDVSKINQSGHNIDLEGQLGDVQNSLMSRHWYSSAVDLSLRHDSSTVYCPFQLPGSFSVRGDWYLSALRESRSEYMAELAVESLTSPRASIDRMKAGVGLPFTKIGTGGEGAHAQLHRGIRTAIPRAVEGRVGFVYYKELLDIAPLENRQDSKGFYLDAIWRSQISGYSESARVFRRWIIRCLVNFAQVKDSRPSDWIGCFEILDALRKKEKEEIDFDKWSDIELDTKLYGTIKISELDTYRYWFKPLLDHLLAELEYANPSSKKGEN
jgi:hypothetical protein